MACLQLLGMKHTGKTTLGTLAARRLGWEFRDLDVLLEAEHRAESGRTGGRPWSSRDIYRELGKDAFQAYEAQAAAKIAPRLAAGHVVLAWGGGTVTNPAAVEALRGWAPLVLLDEKAEVIYERIVRGGLPAFLSKQSPWADFQRLYAERMALLRELATVTLTLGGADVEHSLGLLLQHVQGESHAR